MTLRKGSWNQNWLPHKWQWQLPSLLQVLLCLDPNILKNEVSIKIIIRYTSDGDKSDTTETPAGVVQGNSVPFFRLEISPISLTHPELKSKFSNSLVHFHLMLVFHSNGVILPNDKKFKSFFLYDRDSSSKLQGTFFTFTKENICDGFESNLLGSIFSHNDIRRAKVISRVSLDFRPNAARSSSVKSELLLSICVGEFFVESQRLCKIYCMYVIEVK